MYSIKTDLGVSGNATVNKDLLVKGNAVFKQGVTIEGTVNFADAVFTSIQSTSVETSTLNVSTSATIKDVSVTGNSTLGTDAASVISVNGKSTFNEDVAVQKNITQPTTGTATLGSVTADSLVVTKTTSLKGNLTADVGTTAKFDALETNTLKVSGESTHTGKATFGDVEINGTLSGTYSVDTGKFTNIEVSNQSTLKDLYVSGNSVIDGNITGSNSTATFNRQVMSGQTANITFSYNDPARPLDIKTAIQPYRVSSNDLISNTGDIKRLSTGDSSFSDYGFIGKGISKMDYLDLTGNATLGTNRPRMEVTAGLVKLHDLEITGSVSGLTFNDSTFETITVNGLSTFKGAVVLESNIAGSATSTATFNRYIVSGTTGATGSITFSYNDPSRPLDIRTALTPYQVSSQELTANVSTISNTLTVGSDSNITSDGLVSKGRSTFDYLNIKGNSTEISSKPKLTVSGKTVLEDLEITGSVSGITFDLTGQDINVNSLTATQSVTGDSVNAGTLAVTSTATIDGNVTVGTGTTTTVHDLVVTGTTTGVTAVADVDGLDIAPNSVTTPTATVVALEATNLNVTGDVSIVGSITTPVSAPSVTASGEVKGGTVVSDGSLTGTNVISTGTALSTFAGDVTVGTGTTTTVHDLVVTGLATGIQVEANVDGLDIAPKSVTVTEGVSAASATITGAVSSGSVSTSTVESTTSIKTPRVIADRIVPSTLDAVQIDDIQANIINSGEVITTDATIGDLNVTTRFSTVNFATDALEVKTPGATIAINAPAKVTGNLEVTGTLTPGSIDLSTTAISAASLTTTGDVTIGGQLDVSNANLSAKTYTATDTVAANTLPVLNSTTATIRDLDVQALTPAAINGVVVFEDGMIGSEGPLKIFADADIQGTLTVGTLVPGSLDLSTAAVAMASGSTTGNFTVGGDLTVNGAFDLSTTNLVAASLESSSSVTVATDLVLTAGTITGSPTISGNTSIQGTLGVVGNTTLSTLSTSGLASLNSVTVSGASTLGTTSVTSLSSTGSITMLGTSSLADMYAVRVSSAGKLVVGNGTADADVIAHIKGAGRFDGNLTVAGTINGSVNLDGQTIQPQAVAATTTITAGGNITSQATVTGKVLVAGSTPFEAANVMQVNGNVVCNGDFVVTAPGKIVGQLDMSTSVVDVAGINSTGKVTTATLDTTGLATLASLSVTGTSTFTGDVTAAKLTSSDLNASKLTVNGPTAISGATANISSTALTVSSPTVTVTSASTIGVAGKTNFTGDVTMQNVAISGTLTTDIANLVTNSVSTKKYLVQATQNTNAQGSMTPGLTSNVEYWTLTGNVSLQSMIGTVVTQDSGQAGSWFLYVSQTGANNYQLNFSTGYAAIQGTFNTTANIMNIIQIVYPGYGSVADVFIAQRG